MLRLKLCCLTAMMLFILTLVVWVGVAIVFYKLCKNKVKRPIIRNLKCPPGPWTLPILGYMPFLAFNPLKNLQRLKNQYGDIFTIFIGGYRVIVLSSQHAIKEAFKEDAFCGRPDLKMLEVRNGGVRKGLVCSEGKPWQEQRKFTLRHLKDLGFGKKSMEGLLQEDLNELIKGLRSTMGQPVNLQDKFNLAVLNALWSIICGQRYQHDDLRLQSILQKTSADLAETQYTGPLLFLPWLLKIAPSMTRWKEFVTSINSVHQFLRGIIAEHKQDYDPTQMRDLIDAYLAEIEKTSDPTSSFYKECGEHSLLVVLLDLFMAGADTTSTTLYWAFLYMVLHKGVQKKVQEEIDLVLGHTCPALEHRKLMPYTEATITEILRKSSLVPLGLFHSATCNSKLLGYHIPKDTVIMANFHSINYDKTLWKDPEVFRPERFIHEESKTLIKYDALMPFSTGKRICPGENLARDQLFLYFVGLLQKFTFLPDLSIPIPSDEPNVGVILSPKKYFITVTERSEEKLVNPTPTISAKSSN